MERKNQSKSKKRREKEGEKFEFLRILPNLDQLREAPFGGMFEDSSESGSQEETRSSVHHLKFRRVRPPVTRINLMEPYAAFTVCD